MAFLAVAGGAFGAHALKNILPTDMLEVYGTGIRYQMYHAFGVMVAGGALTVYPTKWFRYAGWAFILGTVLFSGSLYVLSFSGIRWLGAVTPLGGVLFLSGWFSLFLGFLKIPSSKS